MGKRNHRQRQTQPRSIKDIPPSEITKVIDHDDLRVILACLEFVGSLDVQVLIKEGWDMSIPQEEVQYTHYDMATFEDAVDSEVTKMEKVAEALESAQRELEYMQSIPPLRGHVR